MTRKRSWQLVKSFASGRRFFRDPQDYETARLAVADQSGDTPDTTDDGVLWIFFRDPIRLHEHSNNGAVADAWDEDGHRFHILLTWSEMVWLVNEHGVHASLLTSEGSLKLLPESGETR